MVTLIITMMIVILIILITVSVMLIKERLWIAFIFIAIILVFCVGYFGYLGYDGYQVSKCTITTKEVTADITNRQYHSSYTTFIKSGNVNVPVVHNATYDVTLHYDNVTSTINNETLYNSNQPTTKAKLKTYTKPNKEIYKQEIVLE